MTKVNPGAGSRTWSRRARFAAVGLAVSVVASCDSPHGEPLVRITVNPLVRGQVVTGWEAVAQAGQGTGPFAAIEQELFDLAVGDLGINRIRLEVRSGIEHSVDMWAQRQAGTISEAEWRSGRYATVNDNDDPFTIEWAGFHFVGLDATVRSVLLPLRSRLAARGESLFVNATYVAFTRQMGAGHAYDHGDPEEYAEFVLATYLHLQSTFGWVPDTWNVILEPDNTDVWRGEAIGRAVVAAGRRLAQHGFTPRFTLPSTTNMANAPRYFDAAMAVPGARAFVSEFAYHRYYGVSDAVLREIATRGKRYGLRTAMLEHIGSGYKDLHADLTRGNVSAWEQYALAFPGRDDGSKYFRIDRPAPGRSGVVLTEAAIHLRQYFRYVRRGATRIAAASSDRRMDPVAFVNTDGRTVVIIKAAATGRVVLAGLPGGRYGTRHTTRGGPADATDTHLSDGAELETRMPGRGVLTVYARDRR